MAKNRQLPPLAELLADATWCRELARRVAGGSADDLTQDALLAALRRPPRGNVRAWFSAVIRNLARQDRRSHARRARREHAAARGEAVESASHGAQRRELRERLTRAVFELEEPYRSTVVWRFFADETAEAMAARENIPASTVRNRLRRALAQLRLRLEAEYDGDPRAVVAAPLLLSGASGSWWESWRKPLAAAALLIGVSCAAQAAPLPDPVAPAGAENAAPLGLEEKPEPTAPTRGEDARDEAWVQP
ncbi:MAG: RNA polymerase sigma factor [Planctomycetota bacterium]|nr:RNA polymerase sigma factor [Planctomycetota bacterium]